MKKYSYVLSLFAGFLIVLVCLYGHYLLQQRVGLPEEINKHFLEGRLTQIDDVEIEKDEDIEFILSRRSAGESATFYIKTDGEIEKKQGNLIAFYSQAPFPIIYLIIGFFCIIMAFIVFILRPQELRARIFYWLSLVFSLALIVNGGFYCLREEWLSYIPSILYYISYPLAFALLLNFSLTFIKLKSKVIHVLIYLPTIVIIIVWEYLFLQASLTSSIVAHRHYQSVVFFHRFYAMAYIFLTFFSLILSYKTAHLEEHKAQIKWILYGLFLGVGPFILLYQLPRALIKGPFISEEFSQVFFIFIPVAFAFSIIRFKLMNIELIINRSLVYSTLTIFTVCLYLLSVQVIHALFSEFFPIQPAVVTVIAALAAAAAFHPARKKIQEFVDRSFFRLSYDYRKSILSFNERAHKMVHQSHLVNFFLMKVNKTIPLEYLGLWIYSSKTGKYAVLKETGQKKRLDVLGSRISGKSKILTKRNSVQTELGLDFSAEKWMDENTLEMVIPVPFRPMELSGFLALGKKRSGARFTGDDIELLLTMTEALALNLERIFLQEEVIYERAEKEKFDELSRLKTEFISSVSHEIRTPMSSIQGISEILQQGKIKGKKRREELLHLMTDECGRLSRFLHNILDFGKIEQRVKTYDFQKVNLCQLVNEVLKLFEQRLASLRFSVKKHIPQKTVWLSIDPDAVKQALTNLIDNAIKYSSDKREIAVHVIEKSHGVEIQVQDKGIGIPEKEQEKIFSGFYRIAEAKQMEPKGVGLGLKIVKHIMEAHGGEVQVESKGGEGSTFSLKFPRP